MMRTFIEPFGFWRRSAKEILLRPTGTGELRQCFLLVVGGLQLSVPRDSTFLYEEALVSVLSVLGGVEFLAMALMPTPVPTIIPELEAPIDLDLVRRSAYPIASIIRRHPSLTRETSQVEVRLIIWQNGPEPEPHDFTRQEAYWSYGAGPDYHALLPDAVLTEDGSEVDSVTIVVVGPRNKWGLPTWNGELVPA